MTAGALTPVQLPSAGRLGQGTAIEQARAIAEVHAAITVAQQLPRDVARAEREMLRSCARLSLAEKAFYRYSRGGSPVTGPSVQLARELMRCWGNAQYGLIEMRRDDGHGQSEMQAWAWDVETNTRNSTIFIVPHVRDTSNGAKALTDMRDIYENNANNGARRLREMCFAVLPGWFTEDAIAACYRTLENEAGEGDELAKRVEQAIGGFAKFGVTVDHLTKKLGAPPTKWVAADLAQLQVIYRSLQRHETTVEDEFPGGGSPRAVTAADITSGQQAPAPDAPANGNGGQSAQPQRHRRSQQAPSPAAGPASERPEPKIASGQIGYIGAAGKRLGFEAHEAEEFMNCVAILAGVPGLTDIADLTQEQGQQVQKRLGKITSRADLMALTSTGEIPAPEGGGR